MFALANFPPSPLACGEHPGNNNDTETRDAAKDEGKRGSRSPAPRAQESRPFADTKDLIAGYALWQVRSLEEALEWARAPRR